MMCKEMKEDLRLMGSLKDGGRRDVETKERLIQALLNEYEDYRALLMDGEDDYGKEWVIDSCSFHICCEKLFTKLTVCDGLSCV